MKNKIIVITGGASGIGFAIVKALIAKNKVISLDRNPAKIAALKQAFPTVESIKTDITLNEDLNNAIAIIKKTHGKIDILINNAGKGGQFDFVNESDQVLMENIETEIAVNYIAPIRLTKKSLPLLMNSLEPIVVVVSSGLAYIPISFLGTYCASKAAVHFVTMSIRQQLISSKIRVVEVLPPVVDTDLSKDATMPKMPTETFAKIFIKKLSNGENIMNIGQTSSLEKFSRYFPKMAFNMINKPRKI
jgi:short-subunit dehydrogenase involved in D-alanine esterification of teichoic acids